MKTAKIYPVVVPAGGSFVLPAQGDYFKILSSTNPVEVTGDTWGTLGTIQSGQGLEDQSFNRLVFRDVSGAINRLQVLVAGEKFVDDRITGEVAVIDGTKSTTLANSAFVGVSYASANAAQFMSSMLWNNSTTKNLRLKQLRYDVSVNNLTLVHRKVTAVATCGVADPAPASKLFGGADSVNALTYTLSNGAAQPTVTASAYGLDINPTSKLISFQEPMILQPGTGYLVMPNAAVGAATFLSTLFEFVEDPV